MSVLVIDVGNSRTKVASCMQTAVGLPECSKFVACDNGDKATLRRHFQDFAGTSFSAAFIAGSNVHVRDEIVAQWAGPLPSPVVLSSWEQIPVELQIDTPETVGIDRLLNVLGACRLNAGSNIIVDSGTATTIDLVQDGVFLGGAILPGLRLTAQSLHDYTAALPHIDTGTLSIQDVKLPGRNTAGAIAAGILFGQIGAIREIVDRYVKACTGAKLLLTGGAAQRLAPAFPDAELCPYLSLRAMASLAAQNDQTT